MENLLLAVTGRRPMGWQGGFLQCAGPYQLSHVLAGFPIPYLKSEWECFQDSYRHSQKEALT